MTASERIDKIANYLNISIKELSEKCGYDRPQAFYDVQKGKTKNISTAMSDKIISVFPVFSKPWILTGEGSMLNTGNVSVSDSRPRLPITVRGGLPNGFGDSVVLKECEMQPVIKSLPAYDYTMIVTGDSMEPNFVGGDEIAIRKVNDIIEWGGVYVLDTPDGAIIKRLYDEGGSFRCVSFNKDYQDFLVDKESVFGVYKVVGLIRI